MNKYEATIGLEIHAELKTKSKMFCSCKNDPFNSEQNINVCPVCLGMPGMLPVLNRQAIEWTILTGLALNSKIADFTKWDRKNYFYPDLPKGYQISQYDLPIAYDGSLKLKAKNEKLITIGITRIHLEEDTGTSKHPEGRVDVDYSLMDYNRAGVPLMELVTDAITLPIDQAGQVAKEFCQKYQLILRYLGVADADMEKGQMRCEVNISLREITQMNTNKKHEFIPNKLGTKVEIKNLNSFKSVEKAIEYEIERQSELLNRGEKIVQETRGWNDEKSSTYTMRVKETSADYRYFPEPDLPAVRLVRGTTQTENTEQHRLINIDEIKKQLPELPDERVDRYINKYKIDPNIVNILVSNIDSARYFESLVDIGVDSKLASNWVVNELSDLSIKPEYAKQVADQIKSGKISNNIAKELWSEIRKGMAPLDIIKEKGLEQISDSGAIEKIVNKVIKENPEIVTKIKSGQMQVMGFLVGQVMKESRGQANPQVVSEILKKKLK